MKNTLTTALIAFAIFLAHDSHSQITGLSVEPIYVDDGTLNQYPTNGVTYRLYVHLTSPDDVLATIHALPEGNQNDCPNSDNDFIAINTSTHFFQYELFGGAFGEDLFCAGEVLDSSLIYDSYITIGKECNTDLGDPWVAVICPGEVAFDIFEGPVNGDFNDGENLFIDDGAIFILNGDPGAVAGDDLKVLIAQLTTDGSIDGQMTCRAYINGDGDNIDDEFLQFSATPGCVEPDACNFNPNADINNNSCDYSCYGCMDIAACNYDGDATMADGSCVYDSAFNDEPILAHALDNFNLNPVQITGYCSSTDSPEWPGYNEVWYSFTSVFDSAELSISSELVDLQVALFDDSFNLIMELDETTSGAEVMPLDILVNLNVYYIAVASSEQMGTITFDAATVPFLGDLNGDGMVATNDLLELLAQLGCQPFCTADLDNDGIVTIFDLMIMLTAFGGP